MVINGDQKSKMATSYYKRGFKEKIVQMYESLLKSNNLELISDNSNYWNEFFLLKPNLVVLSNFINEISDSSLTAHKNLINLVFAQAVLTLGADNQIKELNGLLTIYGLSRAVFTRPRGKKFDPVDVLIGKRDLPIKIQILNAKLWTQIEAENSIELKRIVLYIYLSLLTGYHSLNDSPIVEHLMADELFESLIKLLGNPTLRGQLGELAVLLITLFVHHSSCDQLNLFSVKLSILDNEMAKNGYAQIISGRLLKYNRKFEDKQQEQTAGILSFLTSRMGTMFVREDNHPSSEEELDIATFDNFLLLSFYDIVHLSRNFSALLTSTHTDLPDEHYEQTSPTRSPTNLMVNFLEFCSIVMLCCKDKQRLDTTRLCFIILNCLTEDQGANATMHDVNVIHKVNLHRLQMRHRKLNEPTRSNSKPLAYSLLDLMGEFISCNMRKEFPLDLYLFSVNVIHRLLCYQKRYKVRYDYDWLNLWHTLISLIKYLLQNEEMFLKKQMNLFLLANNVVNLLNLSITHGDSFLYSPNAYDELYYEIIRMYTVFNKLLALAVKHSMVETFSSSAMQLVNSLSNIKSIINHFNGKIEAFRIANQSNTLTEQEVMDVVRANYDTLTLKLQEGLDVFESYNGDHPIEKEFLRKHILEPVVKQAVDQLAAHLEEIPRLQNELMSGLVRQSF